MIRVSRTSAGSAASARQEASVTADHECRTVAEARAAIDLVDTDLAILLERRARLAGLVQRLKPVGGQAGRSPERERQIVDGMSRHAPRLGRERIARIMNVIIEASLEAAEDDHPGPGPGSAA